MTKTEKVFYIIRIITFIIHFYLLFLIIPTVLQIGISGYIFFIFYLIYIIRAIITILSKKRKYKKDLIYNIMQIGFYFYIAIVTLKVYLDKLVVVDNTITYFNINYIILTLLLTFIFIYDYFELRYIR